MAKGILKKRSATTSAAANKRKRVRLVDSISTKIIPSRNEKGVIVTDCESTKQAISAFKSNMLCDVPVIYILSKSSDMWQKIFQVDGEWTYRTVDTILHERRHHKMTIDGLVEEYKNPLCDHLSEY